MRLTVELNGCVFWKIRMIHVKPTVQYDTLYKYLERDLNKLKKSLTVDLSDEFYNLRNYLFSTTDLQYTLDNLGNSERLPSVMNAVYGQTLTLDGFSPKHKDYWNFFEEWVYTVCATELLIGKQFRDFKAVFLKFVTAYHQNNLLCKKKKSESLVSLAWDENL